LPSREIFFRSRSPPLTGWKPVPHYTESQVEAIKKEVKFYENLRNEVKLHSGDAIDLKQYEPATRWGTCNIEARRIWVNLELAKKPVQCLEYIVVHELAHLIARHHDDRFVVLMNQHLPQWRAQRAALNAAPLAHSSWNY